MKVVVYNRFDLDAVLAAALIKSLGNPNVMLVENTVIVPAGHDEYLWLGMELEKVPFGAKSEFKNKVNHHIKATETDENGFLSILYQCMANIIDAEEPFSNESVEVIMRLNGALKKFHSNDLTLEEIILVFNNLKIAEGLLLNTGYKGNDVNIYKNVPLEKGKVQEFYAFINAVKKRINNKYTHQYVKFKSRLLETFVTSVNEDWFWIKRLLVLGDQNYANVNMCPIGCVVDSNLPNLDDFRLDVKVKPSHIY